MRERMREEISVISIFPFFSLPIPYNNFIYMNATTNTKKFKFISSKIEKIDTEFFAMESEIFNRQYFVTAEIDYDEKSAKFYGTDFSGFPYKRKVFSKELSSFQRKTLRTRNDNIGTERLISTCEHSTISAFLDTIFLSIILLGAKIVKINNIISANCYAFLETYVEKLATARAREKSRVHSKCLKLLLNSLAGKFHSKIDQLCKSKTILNPTQFDQALVSDNFLDVTPIGIEIKQSISLMSLQFVLK